MKPVSKPLFIPLKTEHYTNFKLGLKTHEIRLNSGKWNRGVCFPGRRVFLSKGYGKQERLAGRITSVDVFPAYQLPTDEYADFVDCYGEGEDFDERPVIYIGINTDQFDNYKLYVDMCHMEMQEPLSYRRWVEDQ